MPLETATYTNDLVTSNPAHSDGLNNADAHLRLVKGTLKATFPNFTSAPLNSTQAQIDAITANGASVLADAGANFKTNTTDGLRNPSAGTLGLSTGGTVTTTFTSGGIGTASINASGTVAGTHTGPGALPIGAPLMWLSDTLPSGFGTFAWANGQSLLVASYPALFAVIGYTYGGSGANFSLPNWQEVTLVGKSTMGGASSPGLLTSISSGLKTLLGKIFGNDTTTLITANLPPYTPAGSVSGTVTLSNNTSVLNATATSFTISSPGGVPVTEQTIGASFSGSFTGTAQGGTSTAFSNLPPMFTVNFIIRIA